MEVLEIIMSKKEDVKNLLIDWNESDGCLATNRITVEGCKVGYCYREEPDGDWDSGWRFTAGDESEAYMSDQNNAGIYKLNTICITLLNTPAPCAFERDARGVFKQIEDWKAENEEENMDILQQCQKCHEDYFSNDHLWYFRMGNSYYYLDQDGRALTYFHKALERRPEDEDTKALIDLCEKRISLPQFGECFKERTKFAWEEFIEQEKELRKIMDEDENNERGEELIKKCEDILNIAFYDVAFELGFNGEKYELILTPEGDKVKLFELVYFAKHAPKETTDNWNILVGRQATINTGLRVNDFDINGDDVLVWVNKNDEGVDLSVYCEKTLTLWEEDMDMLHADGSVAGFFCYPLSGFTGDDSTQQIFDFRDSLEEYLLKNCG